MLNRFSRLFTQEPRMGGAKAMLYAAGLTDEQMDQPQIGISAVWYVQSLVGAVPDHCRTQPRRAPSSSTSN